MNETGTGTERTDNETIEREVLLRSLDQSRHPLTASQLRDRLTGPYKLKLEKIEELLERQVGLGGLYSYPGTGQSRRRRYWTHGIEEYAREVILTLLATRAMSMSDLVRRSKISLRELDEAGLRRLVASLVREGALREWPPVLGGRTAQYSVLPPDPRAYLEDAIDKIARKLGVDRVIIAASAGEIRAETVAANPETDGASGGVIGGVMNEKLLERMVQMKLAAAQGAPIPLQDLWHSFKSEGWDKATFDKIVLELASGYRVTLLKHAFPGSLSEKDRSELVADHFGNYYVGIALR